MRIVKMYTIYDKVALMTAGWPFKANTEGEALRTFQSIVHNDQTTISRNPQDYVLLEIGTYDQVEGKVTGYDIVKNICTGVELLRMENEAREEENNETRST